MMEESIGERDCKNFVEGLSKEVYSVYFHDAGTRLLFKFRSGTHGLSEELGRHRGREGKKECVLCGDECDRVCHVLWECPASIRADFLQNLQECLGECLTSMNSSDKATFVLGNELWVERFESLLGLVKYIIEERKSRLYGDNACTRPQSPTGDLGDIAGLKGGMVSDCVRKISLAQVI